MIKIVKNKGQCKAKALRNCKYLLVTDDFYQGNKLYAKVRPRPILGYILAKIKGDAPR